MHNLECQKKEKGTGETVEATMTENVLKLMLDHRSRKIHGYLQDNTKNKCKIKVEFSQIIFKLQKIKDNEKNLKVRIGKTLGAKRIIYDFS